MQFSWYNVITALVWVLTLGNVMLARKVKREILDIMDAIGIMPDDEDATEFAWLMDMDEEATSHPMYVPLDMTDQAIQILEAETSEDQARMDANQWHWQVDAWAIRNAMAIAQDEPDLEMALMAWMAQMPLPPTQ